MNTNVKTGASMLILAASAMSATATDYYVYRWDANWSDTNSFRIDTTQTTNTVAGPTSGDNDVYFKGSTLSTTTKAFVSGDLKSDITIRNVIFDADTAMGTMAYFESPWVSMLSSQVCYNLNITGNVTMKRSGSYVSNGFGFRSSNVNISGNVTVGDTSYGVNAFFGGASFVTGSKQIALKGLNIGGTLKTVNSSNVYIGLADNSSRGTMVTGTINKVDLSDTSDLIFSADPGGNLSQTLEIKSFNGGRRAYIYDVAGKGFIAYTTFKFTNTESATSNIIIGYNNTLANIDGIMAGTSTGIQNLTNTSSRFGYLDVNSGTLWYAGSVLEDLSIGGGSFGAGIADNTNAVSVAGNMNFDQGKLLVNCYQDACNSINVTGSLSVADTSKIELDFNVLGGTVIEGQEYKFLTFGNTDLTQGVIDSITTNISVKGYKANLTLGTDYIGATFVAVPEPAVYAVFFGALALAFATYRRRK